MASTTISPGRTIRKIRPIPQSRNNFERAMWLYMRYSGLVLVFLALSHFWLQHILIGTHAITPAQTVTFWGAQGQPITLGQVLFRLYYALMLVLAVTHGINGVRQVAYDYFGQAPAVYKGLMAVIIVIAGLISLGGIVALILGAQASGAVATR
jgi:succinate dehydrogenase / fumarate reductase membrane anchor subunit